MRLLIAAAFLFSLHSYSESHGPDIPGITGNGDVVIPSNVEKRLMTLATKEQICKINYLKDLGWNIKPVDGSSINVSKEPVCEHETLAEAKQKNKLVISLNRTATDEELKKLLSDLDTITESKASKCAYKLKVADATKEATKKLHEANHQHRYTFSNSSDPFVGSYNTNHWESTGNNCIRCTSSPEKAVKCYYDGPCRSECAVGLQVASLAVLLELYGPDEFAKRFKNNEICVGAWSSVHYTDSPIEGSSTSGVEPEDEGYFELGKQALVGVRGYIGNIRGEAYLDQPADRGENMIIVDMSQKAVEEVKKLGSLKDGTKRMNIEIWAGLTEGNRKQSENDYLSYQGISTATTYARAEELLKNPIYSETKVYVHPLGLMTFADHLKRLARHNPRTPYDFRLYSDKHMTSLYDRYTKTKVDACLGN